MGISAVTVQNAGSYSLQFSVIRLVERFSKRAFLEGDSFQLQKNGRSFVGSVEPMPADYLLIDEDLVLSHPDRAFSGRAVVGRLDLSICSGELSPDWRNFWARHNLGLGEVIGGLLICEGGCLVDIVIDEREFDMVRPLVVEGAQGLRISLTVEASAEQAFSAVCNKSINRVENMVLAPIVAMEISRKLQPIA